MKRTFLLSMLVALCVCFPEARAVIYFEDGGAHNIGYSIDDDVVVRNSSSGFPTTVEILPGSLIYYLWINDTSQATISGSVSYLRAQNNGQVAISGGSVIGASSSDQNSQVTISSGSVGAWVTYGNSQLNISGGSLAGLHAHSNSTVIIEGSDFELFGGLSWDIDGQTILGTGTLTGRWLDNTSFAIPIEENDLSAAVIAVPEPTTLLLLGMSGILIRKR